MTEQLTTVASFIDTGVLRGDYIVTDGEIVTMTGPFAGERKLVMWRVTRATSHTLTVRPRHCSYLAELAHAKLEDWILWPIADLRVRLRGTT